ncbi:hypothetical protein P153DRAFT_387033 [Dothidotthia symphoricarpi CBS 119687]|uniref:BTB domain-containing protein n=1 Tax=Dothidotthia symphoricarpi CBS 119687 TaxID=1392245 RepID=A0A6A6ABI2_9PLEO|nr:uncharacterized protein P153DRAFT_387033 [Dothidotthia symphoricarpi CBS 119687]KAF2128061.1 hypothetical protein P153DRAFT_387033 [Dothidotthia symphoricarpi CBS 119687]
MSLSRIMITGSSNDVPTDCDERNAIVTRANSHTCYLSMLPPPQVALYDTMVQVSVGRDVQRISHVHKGLISYHSGFFARIFDKSIRNEAQSGVVRLDQDDPEIFKLFYSFIYTGRVIDSININYDVQYCVANHQHSMPIKLYLSHQTQDHVQKYAQELCVDNVTISFSQLFGLAVFAHTYDIPVIRDTVLSLVCQKICTERRLPADLLQHLHDHLPRESKLVELLTSVLAFCVDMHSISSYRNHIPRAMMANMFYCHRYMYATSRGGIAPGKDQEMNACHWHTGCELKVSNWVVHWWDVD